MVERSNEDMFALAGQIMQLGDTWKRVAELMDSVDILGPLIETPVKILPL